MPDHDLRAGVGRDPEHVGIGQAARHVVDDGRAGGDRALGDIGAIRVDAHECGAVCEAFDHGQDPSQFFVRPHGVRSGPRRLASDVEDRRPLGDERMALRHGRVVVEELAPVAERVGRDVDDAHDLDHGCPRPATVGSSVALFCTPMIT